MDKRIINPQIGWFTHRLKTWMIAGGLLLLSASVVEIQAQGTTDPRVAKIVAETVGIDTHNHVDVPLDSALIPGPKVDMAGELQKSGLSVICMTFAVDYQRLTHEGQAYSRFLNGLTAMDALLKDNHATRAFNLQDIETAHKNKQPIVIQSVEGSHFLEGKIERLQVAYDRGLRHLGLLHDNDASVPLGDIYTNQPKWGGLTAFGAQVIKECERLGMVVDLTHCDNHTIDMALKLATKPMLISHTGLDTQLGQDPGMARMMRPRLISAMEAKKVADAGGLIGVWTHLSESPLEYAKNIRAMVDVVGVDHVCIGTDTKLTTPYHPFFQGNGPGDDRSNHQGFNDKDHPVPNGPGDNRPRDPGLNGKDQPKPGDQGDKPRGPGQGRPQGVRVGERTNLAWKDQTDGFYYAVVDALLKTGFTESDIQKIGGGNYLRLFDAVTKGH